MPGVCRGALRDAVAGPCLDGLGGGQVAETHARGKTLGRGAARGLALEPAPMPVQQLRREERARALPVLRAAPHHQARPGPPQPPCRAVAPLGEAAGQEGRHLLGAVEEEQQRAAGTAGQAGEAGRAGVAEVFGSGRGPGAGGGDDAGGPVERPLGRVGDGEVVLPQIGAAQPQRGAAGPVAAGGERRELRRTAAAGRPDETEDRGRAVFERGELRGDGGPLHRNDVSGGECARRAVLPDRGGGEFQHTGEVEVGAVRRDRRRVLGEEGGEGPGAGRSGTAKPPSRPPARSAVPRTPRTAPVAASSTGPPAAPPPVRSASRPAVPMASSSASSRVWQCSVAVYVTVVGPSTRASRQHPAAIRT
ncbi:hypothetical protein SHIRM173S_04706 [Streptomyces hirsutus]